MPESAPLYLDAARLGAMSPTAQLAARDFARLAGEGLSTLYTEEFLRHGWSGRDSRRRRFPGLANWSGVDGVKVLVRRAVQVRSRTPVFFSGRASAFMRFAARAIFARGRNVLVTDTLWPPYRDLLYEERRHCGARVTTIPIRSLFDSLRHSPGEVAERMAAAFQRQQCDSLFLPAVSHDGIRLPVREVLRSIRAASVLKLAVVDGAQELAHVPVRLAGGECDLYFAGSQKWLQAYQPLGIALLPNPATAAELEKEMAGGVDDPLLRFLVSLDSASRCAIGETTNLCPLFSAWGALRDLLRPGESQTRRFVTRLENRTRVNEIARMAGWQAVYPSAQLRSGILLLRSSKDNAGHLAPADLQRAFEECGVVMTAYPAGYVRLALPDRPLRPRDLRLLRNAFAAV